MVTVATISVQDNHDAAPQVKLLSVSSSGLITGSATGIRRMIMSAATAARFAPAVRQRDSGTYTMAYQATDAAGNVTNAAATVAVVPHN
jgi:hypothetical protein